MSDHSKDTPGGLLNGCRILIPENRQLDILAALVENRGGQVNRVPLVSIHDAPDPGPVLDWLQRFIVNPPDLLVLLTGEGLRRLLSLAAKNGLEEKFIAVLGKVPALIRGPKPGRVLSDLGYKAQYQAAEPTTGGVISTLATMDIASQRVGVQLYGTDPNTRLINFLAQQGAVAETVAPYVYADQSEETEVIEAIKDMAAGRVDMIAFTSQPQFNRLQQVANKYEMNELLNQGLEKVRIACVGPVVRDQLEAAGYTVRIMPEKQYFMKPLVTAMVRNWQGRNQH